MSLRFSRLVGSSRKARSVLLGSACAAALVAGLMTPAMALAAEPAVNYDGEVQAITVDGYQDTTDLFVNFKDLMPGDKLEQDIELSFTNIEAPVRLYIKAGEAQLMTADGWGTLSEYAKLALKQMTLVATVPGADGTTVKQLDSDQPNYVFADENPTLVASVSADATVTLHLELTVPTSIGNEMNDLADVLIPWEIIVQDENDGGGGGDEPGPGPSTGEELNVDDLTAYEGGIGSTSTVDRTDNLPEPDWSIDWDTAKVTVGGKDWDVDEQGLPFEWSYGTTTEDGFVPVPPTGALVGVYHLQVKPLEGGQTVIVNGKILEFPADGIVTNEDGSDVMVFVRDVTDDDAADALHPDYFKDVFGGESSSLLSLLSLPWDDDEFTGAGTHTGDCDNSVAHAHVKPGTTFVKNNDKDRPVKEGAKVGLLWDELISNVLGQTQHMETLDAKARAAVGWTDKENVQTGFRYLDLVDMNDGNVWVATADGSDTTIFIPYPEGMSAEDEVALVRFEGLTRDYTIDLDMDKLTAAVADSTAVEVEVTKAADGILFDVPCAKFGPFELMWVSDGAVGPDVDEPGTDEPGGPDEPGEPGEPGEPDTPDGPGSDRPAGDRPSDRPHDELIAETGDALPTFMPLLAGAGVVLVVVAVVLLKRSRKQK